MHIRRVRSARILQVQERKPQDRGRQESLLQLVGGSSFSEYLAVLVPIVLFYFIYYISIQSMIDHDEEEEEETADDEEK